jgi:hypothetical protein
MADNWGSISLGPSEEPYRLCLRIVPRKGLLITNSVLLWKRANCSAFPACSVSGTDTALLAKAEKWEGIMEAELES